MKKILFIAFVIISLSSCLKKEDNPCDQSFNTPQAPAAEIANVQSYLTSAGITNAIQHSSGLFYIIIDGGTGTVTPGQCNLVAVRYSGRLTNGTVFDQATTPQTFPLSNLISGWRIGIPLVKAGGTVRLFIPPSLGYGSAQVGTIPPNSILIFDIDLVNVG